MKAKRSPIDPESVALAVFGRIASEPDRLGRFLSVTGLGPDTIRGAAASPGFLGAVLDYVSSDEELLLDVAHEAGIDPTDIARARHRLASPEPDAP